MEVLILITVGLIGLILGFFIAKGISNKETTKLQFKAEEFEKQFIQKNDEIKQIKILCEDIQNKLHQREITSQRLQTELLAKEDHLKNLKEDISQISQEKLISESIKNKNEQELSSINARLEEVQKSHYEQIESSRKNHHDLLQQFNAQKNALDEKNKEYLTLSNDFSKLKTSLQERENNFAEQKVNFNQQKIELTAQFKALANDILDAKAISLQETSKVGISSIMNPFQQALESFKKEVHEIHNRETQQQGELRQELSQLKELNQKITTEAHHLATALRGQKKTQGNWGELILENVLERSGLQIGKDFKREVSISTDEGRLRPDVIIYLPQNKHLIIDSKVSLNAYSNYINAEDEDQQKLAITEHVKAVSDRINELASKEYFKIKEFNSPEIIFMFIPIESAFVEALKADESIFQKALEKNILVATPTTLLTSLNIVRQLWRFEEQNKHTAMLVSKADDVFQKMRTFLDSFKDIKKHLEKATESYQKSENQLVNGRGNLIKQVNEFKTLAPTIQNNLPLDLVEKANLELDYAETHKL